MCEIQRDIENKNEGARKFESDWCVCVFVLSQLDACVTSSIAVQIEETFPNYEKSIHN